MPGDAATFKSELTGTCPFCKKTFEAGHDAEGHPGLLHEMPMCKEFEDLEPDEYLRAVRMKYSS